MEANCSLPCLMTYVHPCFTSSPGPPIQYNRMNCVQYKGIVALTISQESVPQTCLVYLKKTFSHLGFLLLKCVKFKMKKSHKHNYIYYKLELKLQCPLSIQQHDITPLFIQLTFRCQFPLTCSVYI